MAGVTVLLASACAAPQADGPSTGGTAAPSAAPESPAERIAAGAYAGPVDIGGGRQIYLECRGTGAPTVVLISGYHDSADLWSISDAAPPAAVEAVLPGLAGRYRICAFDRPGTLRYSENQGSVTTRSTPVPMPRTAADVVADLHAMLQAARVPGPYMLTAHSLGGIFARLYAQTYPADVRGLVLVDTFAPEVPALFGPLWPAYRELLDTAGTQRDPNAERIDIDASIGQLQQAPPLREVPVAVLSKTEPFGGLPPTIPGDLTGADIERIWPQVQSAVVAIRPQTPQTLVTDSDHYIQVHQPDVVISSTDLIVGRAAAS